MNRLFGAFLLLMSLFLFLVAAATLFSLFRALTVESTLPAIESAFGSLVIIIGLLVIARMALRAGIVRARHKKQSN